MKKEGVEVVNVTVPHLRVFSNAHLISFITESLYSFINYRCNLNFKLFSYLSLLFSSLLLFSFLLFSSPGYPTFERAIKENIEKVGPEMRILHALASSATFFFFFFLIKCFIYFTPSPPLFFSFLFLFLFLSKWC